MGDQQTLTEEERGKKIGEILKDYMLDDGTYKKISEILLNEMRQGLGRDTNGSANVKMFPTYVRALPDGSERGNFLALDLGGTNFRVLLIRLEGDKVHMKNRIFNISQKIMQGQGTELFDHIASCIAVFMKDNHLVGEKLPLGFTFSFPCKQEGLAVGRLVRWTKGFVCEGVEGEDVVRLLHEAVKRRGDIEVDCVAILNDTVGCLMSCAFLDHSCEVGLILGTGTNACYMEKLDKVQLWDEDKEDPSQVIINTEWGAFGDNGVLDFIRTEEDIAVDKMSLNPGKQLFEKMISGMYMGEICRRVIERCAKEGLLFQGEYSEELCTPSRFYTKYVSEIESDPGNNGDRGCKYTHTRQVLDELDIEVVDSIDCKFVKQICTVISTRAAYLASAGVATLLNRINKPTVTVAVDGSLYRFHPHFHNRMMEKIRDLLHPGLSFRLMLSNDGSGKGAAIVAAVASRGRGGSYSA